MSSAAWVPYAAAGMPPTPPLALSGVWAKMAHAEQHYRALIAAAEAYVATPPYKVTEEVVASSRIIRAEITSEPPLTLALILGDLVHCLRSSLDHMAYAFARTQVAEPFSETAFPILTEAPPDFAGHWRLRDIPPPVVETMEALQPYQPHEVGIGGAIGRELHVLRELSNRDKHRMLLVASALVQPQYVSFTMPEEGESPILFEQDGWHSASITVPTDPDGKYGAFDPHFKADVTLLEEELPLPWLSGLEGIAHNLYNQTAITIAAFRLHWGLL